MANYDIVIRNGLVVDGEGAAGIRADVAIQNGLIRPFNVVQPLIASRDIHSFFGEVAIPIVSQRVV